MAKTKPFDLHTREYDDWFEKHHFAYLSELEALRKVCPNGGRGVEIGVGSGKFAAELKIGEGCDPSEAMRKRAIERGIHAIPGVAEKLPYDSASFDFALMVTTICFVDNPLKSLREIHRILKPEGVFIVGFVDRNSHLGKHYLTIQQKSRFYREATFFSAEEIFNLLDNSGFYMQKTRQTIFSSLEMITSIQKSKPGYNEGSFVVVKAMRTSDK